MDIKTAYLKVKEAIQVELTLSKKYGFKPLLDISITSLLINIRNDNRSKVRLALQLKNILYHIKLHLWFFHYPGLLRKKPGVDHLLFIEHNTHWHQLLPVYQELQHNGKKALVIVSKGYIHKALKLRDVNVINSNSMLGFALVIFWFRWFVEVILYKWYIIRKVKTRTGLSEKVFRINYVEILRRNYIFEHILRKFTPECVFIGNDLTYEGRAVALQSRNLGIPSIALMHGTVNSDLDKEHVVNLFGVYGKIHLEQLMKVGLKNTKIVVTGAPYLDNNMPPLSKKREIILVLTSGPGNRISENNHRQIVKLFHETFNAVNGIEIIIKLHPKDNLSFYSGFSWSENVRIIKQQNADQPIFHWMQNAICIITTASTTALEAMLMNIPVITIDLNDEITNVDFIKENLTHHITSILEFKEVFALAVNHRLTKKEDKNEFLQSYFSKEYHSAAKRVVMVMEKLCVV